MTFSANISKARLSNGAFYIVSDAYKLLKDGEIKILLGPTAQEFAVGHLNRLERTDKGYLRCRELYRREPGEVPLPLCLGDTIEYTVTDGHIRLMSIRRQGSSQCPPSKPGDDTPPSNPRPFARQSTSSNHSMIVPAVPLSARPDEILKQLVDWIQRESFQRQKRTNKTLKPIYDAPVGTGWDFRIRQYSYAKSPKTDFSHVYFTTAPVIERMRTTVARYDWKSIESRDDINAKDLAQLEADAEWICKDFGGVPQSSYYITWKVIRSAVLGERFGNAVMNSGWTKVAAFATDGLPTAQTIWDSRLSTSIIWRADQILHSSGLQLTALSEYPLGLVKGENSGTRPRRTHFDWPNGYGKWKYHFAGGNIVRKIVSILNEPAYDYPRMPQPNGESRNWDVFGVGLVLFMDGY